MTSQEPAVQIYFILTVSALAAVLMAAVVVMMVLSHRTSKNLTAHLEWILALPAGQISVWVSSFVGTDCDLRPSIQYTLWAQAKDGPSVKLTDDHDRAVWACRVLAREGRPVPTAPAWWREKR